MTFMSLKEKVHLRRSTYNAQKPTIKHRLLGNPPHILKDCAFSFHFIIIFKSYKLVGFALICIKGNRLPYVSSLETRQGPKASLVLRKPCLVETPCSV